MSFFGRAPWLVGLLSGVLFAIGLALSGMTDPAKVLGFLDVLGEWDPTLAAVMGGAVGFHFVALRLSKAEAASSSQRRIDARLLVGATIFGIGWGMSGYCPGPALVSAAFGRREALTFVLAMLLGIVLFHAFDRRRKPALSPAS